MSESSFTGRTFGQYQIEARLGTGGMGTVYRAFQPSLNRHVAIKILAENLAANPTYRDRFLREARTAAALEHPAIIPLHDFGTEGETAYVVMKILTGGSLADHLEDRRRAHQPLPPPDEVADLLEKLAAALDYAHRKGVIHRDIKPNNVMFDEHGAPYLVDFGIAKLTDQAATALTAEGGTLGTPTHMAPEQWRGDAVPASDQYALAIVIYQVLTGELPFQAPTPYALMAQHIETMPTPPHELRADLPPAVTDVLERALAKKPADRFPTISAFAAAFREAAGAPLADDSPPTLDVRPTLDGTTVLNTTPPTGATPLPRTSPARTHAHADAPTTLLTPPAPTAKSQRGLWIGGALALVGIIGAALLFILPPADDDDETLSAEARTSTVVAALALNQTATAALWTPTPTATASPTITPTATPVPVDDETVLLLLADFEGSGELETDIVLWIEDAGLDYRRLGYEMPGETLAEQRAAARELSALHNATLVMWGIATATTSQVYFETTPRRALPANEALVTVDEFTLSTSFSNYQEFMSLQGGGSRYVIDFTLGQIAYFNKDWDAANAAFDRALDLLPAGREKEAQAHWLYFYRGSAHYRLRDSEAALADLGEATRLEPEFTDAYLNRGVVYTAASDYAAARSDFDTVIRLRPDAPDAYVARGNLRALTQDEEGAIADFSEAIRLDPTYALAYFARGMTYLFEGDFARAMADLDTSIRLNPGDPIAFYMRGLAFSLQGDYPAAIADYDAAIALDPTDPDFFDSRAQDKLALDDLSGALADYDEALRLSPADANLYRKRGEVRAAAEDGAGALADYDEAIRLDPTSDETYIARGDVRLTQGDVDGALADYSEAIRLAPDNHIAYVSRYLLYLYYLEDCPQAQADYDTFIALIPTLPAILRSGAEDLAQTLGDELARLCTLPIPTPTLAINTVSDPLFATESTLTVPGRVIFPLAASPGGADAVVCTGGTQATVIQTVQIGDGSRWVEITCDGGTGWALETALVAGN